MRTLAVLAFVASTAFAPAALGAQSPFSIRFFEKKVYFLGDPVQVEVMVANTSTQSTTFRLADNRVFSLDFDVRTTTNVALEHAQEFTIGRTSDQPAFFRDVTLQPQEQFSTVIDLAAWVSFTEPGLYVVQGLFYPDLFTTPTSSSQKSNRLSLNIRPAPITAEERALVSAQTATVNVRQPLPPDQVVEFTIRARQQSQWDKFFLYLDLEQLMRRSPDHDRAFRSATESQRATMIGQFRQELQQGQADDISTIPSSFEIQKTTYGASDGTVVALERFGYTGYTELRSYTWYLKKVNGYWMIVDYGIKNLGTE